jgi:hypothetical protein
MFHEFSRFDGQGHRQILGRMELMPIPAIDECVDQLTKFRNGGVIVGHCRGRDWGLGIGSK